MDRQACQTLPPRDIRVSADDIERFSGRRPLCQAFHLTAVSDQGRQFELATDFDYDDDEVNAFYGIPFGLEMLVVGDEMCGDPVGFISFRRGLVDLDDGPDGARRVHYEFHIYVFMVRPDMRTVGYGSALAVGALTVVRDDLEHLCLGRPPEQRPHVAVRFVGEAKSEGGLALLERVARGIGVLPGEMRERCNLHVSSVEAEIVS